jgi:hypothetical protein
VGAIGRGSGGDGSNCESVGESNLHKKLKSLAADRLEQVFDDAVATCEMERELDAPVSGKNRRLADSAAVFTEQDEQLGQGIIAEVQYKNEAKDIDETTADYVEQDFAVAWLNIDDFSENRCLLEAIDFRARAQNAVWPEFIPDAERWVAPSDGFRAIRDQWNEEFRNEVPTSGAPATLPPDWVDQQALELWRSQPWKSLFRPSNTSRCILRGLLEQPIPSMIPNPALPPEVVDFVAQSLWESKDWEMLFSPPEDYLADLAESLSEYQAEIDFAPLINESTWKEWWQAGAVQDDLRNAEVFIDFEGRRISRSCRDCGSSARYNIVAEEQGYNGFYCESCAGKS